MPWVYILRCADDSFYVGSTRDLEARLQQHATGGGDAYTRSRRPLELAWAQECEHIDDAYVLEHQIKGWRREKKLALISGRYGDLPRLSRSGSHMYPASGGCPRALSVPFDGLSAPFDRLRAQLLIPFDKFQRPLRRSAAVIALRVTQESGVRAALEPSRCPSTNSAHPSTGPGRSC